MLFPGRPKASSRQIPHHPKGELIASASSSAEPAAASLPLLPKLLWRWRACSGDGATLEQGAVQSCYGGLGGVPGRHFHENRTRGAHRLTCLRLCWPICVANALNAFSRSSLVTSYDKFPM